MKTREELQARINALKEKLLSVEDCSGEELKKNYEKWDFRMLRFLNREEHVWRNAIAELEWVLSDD